MSLASLRSSALERLRKSVLKQKEGDSLDGQQPYALIHVQLFKPGTQEKGQSADHHGFDDEAYQRTLERIEHVIRVNRHSRFSSLIDLVEFFLPIAFWTFGVALGFSTAFEVALRFQNP